MSGSVSSNGSLFNTAFTSLPICLGTEISADAGSPQGARQVLEASGPTSGLQSEIQLRSH